MKVIIDRFEGCFAIVEITEGLFEKIPKILLPNAQEGDVISIVVEKKETQTRTEKIKDLMNQAFEEE